MLTFCFSLCVLDSKQGIRNDRNCVNFPSICKIVAESPEVASMVLGDVKLSVIEAGTHIKAHTGATNMKIRLHFGIVVQSGGAVIRVGTEKLRWREGKCLAFDDSFEHEVVKPPIFCENTYTRYIYALMAGDQYRHIPSGGVDC